MLQRRTSLCGSPLGTYLTCPQYLVRIGGFLFLNQNDMSTLEWKKVITLNTEKGKEVKIDLYVDSIQITLPNKDKILLEESDFHCFIGLLTDDE